MRARIRFALAYFVCWVAYFEVGRLLFLGWYWQDTATLGFGTFLGVLAHGLRMDAASAAYLMLVPVLALMATSYVPWKFVRWLVAGWTGLFVVVVAALTIGDLGLFREWGFRLDSTWLMYINRPREMIASAGSSPVTALLTVFVVYGALGFWAFRRWALPPADDPDLRPVGWPVLPAGVFSVLVLTFVSRGGFQLTPLTHSSVYFSDNDFADQATLNVGWNFFYSVNHHEYQKSNPYAFLPAAEARARADTLLAPDRGVPPRLFRLAHPNVIVVIWESFSAKLAASTGGRSGVVPEFDSLARTGILFDSIYASGNRTEKGLPAILSGYPALGNASILKSPRKFASLPGLARDLGTAGYDSRFLYAGELAWANFRYYLRDAGFHTVSGEEAFSGDRFRTKWGYHDQVLFERADGIVDSLSRPFLFTLLTLSSHDPYDIPVAHAFPGNDVGQLFLSAHHYSDSTLGAFVRTLAAKPVWDSTVVIILADHGHRLPELDPPAEHSDPSAFHIPMLWVGGALAVHDTVIHTIGSQTDLASTLLDQLDISRAHYTWGDDLLLSGHRPDAYYGFHDGFGYLDRNGGFTYNDVGRRVMQHWGAVDSADVRNGMALQQQLVADYEAR
ncbi:MAG TPA: sulfatase-like hydrolase/transferase [Gemmatimonadales bacterium]|nr:sulfatase-like hydrolase/transferase [Gemmatimonadales bacterium]